MAVMTAIAIASATAAVVGAGTAIYGMAQQKKASEQQAAYQSQAIDAQKRAEASRKQAMDLDANRRRREMVRNQIAANAQAQTVATNQGAGLGSGLPGAYGGISGRSGVNELGVNQNQQIGGEIFDANSAASDAYRGAAMAGSRASTAAGMTSLGSMMLTNSDTIGKVGGFFFPSTAAA
jgi:hypothetical protein